MKSEAEVREVQEKCQAAQKREGVKCPFWPTMPCVVQECGIPKSLKWILDKSKKRPDQIEEWEDE